MERMALIQWTLVESTEGHSGEDSFDTEGTGGEDNFDSEGGSGVEVF